MEKNIEQSVKALILTISLCVVYVYLAAQLGEMNIYRVDNKGWKTLLNSFVVAALVIHVALFLAGYEIARDKVKNATHNENKPESNHRAELIYGRSNRWAFDVLTLGLISWLVLLVNPSFSDFVSRYFYHLIVITIFISFCFKYSVEVFYFYRARRGHRLVQPEPELVKPLLLKKSKYRNLLFLVIFLAIDIPIFFLLKPIFVWNYGWEPQPDLDQAPMDVQIYKEVDNHLTSEIEEQMQRLQVSIGAPAISLAIAHNGQLVWAGARGYRSFQKNETVNIHTRFRTGSVAKPLTAVAAARLVAKGTLDLDQSIYQYGVRYQDPKVAISARQLLSHTAGIRNYQLCFCFPIWEYYSDDEYEAVDETLAITQSSPLMFTPGSNFSYTTYGYNLLAATLEAAYEKNYLDIMEQEVFKPLSMTETIAERPGFIPENTAMFYVRNGQSIKEAIYVDNSNKWAGGGFLTTPTDLVRLGLGFLDESFLDEKTREVFLIPQQLSDGKKNPQEYALGFRVKTSSSNGERLLHHGGTAVGSIAFLLIRPADKTVIAIMSNVDRDSSAILGDAAEKIIELIDGVTPSSK